VNPLTAKKDWEVNQRDHRKLLVVDGRTAFVGGISISGVYSAPAPPAQRKPRPEAVSMARHPRADHRGRWSRISSGFPRHLEKQKGPRSRRRFFPVPVTTGGGWCVPSAARRRSVQPHLATCFRPSEPRDQCQLTIAYCSRPQLLAALKAPPRMGRRAIILPGKTDFWLVFHAEALLLR
jgi:cardiolipin synthase